MNYPRSSDLRFVTTGNVVPVKPGAFKRWSITLSTTATSICSAMIGLRCLQPFSDNSIKPITGCLVYLIGTLILWLYFFALWRFTTIYEAELAGKKSFSIEKIESPSDSILRWMISVIAVCFGLLNLATTMVCVYNLPDKTSRPIPGIIFATISTLFVCGLFLRLKKEKEQDKRQLSDHINNAAHELSAKESRIQRSGALQQWIAVVSAIIVSFSGVLASYTCMYSLPDQVSLPFIGSLFYLISASVLGSYFILQWKGEKKIHAYDIHNGGQKIIIKEYFSEKLIKWMMAIYTMGYTLLSIATAILCLFSGLPDKGVRPDAAVIFLFSGLSVIAILVYVLWKYQPCPIMWRRGQA